MSLDPLLTIVVIVALPLIAWGLVHELSHRRFKRAVYARQNAESDWQSRFPDEMPVVDRVLTIACEAFLLKDRYRYHLGIDDRIIAIYRNTTGPVVDEMQYETLMIRIDDEFGVDLAEQISEETTLADLVRMVLKDSSVVRE